MAGFQVCDALLEDILEYVDDIPVILDRSLGEGVLSETGGTLTTDGTEQNVYINEAPAGLYEPRCLKLDCTNHTAGETIVVRVRYRIAPGAGYVIEVADTHAGAITPALLHIDLHPNRFGVQVTVEKIAGANRDYGWEVFYEV